MDRRALLRTVSGVLGAGLAGCLGGGSETGATTATPIPADHSVTVTRTVRSQAGLRRVLRAADGGNLTVEVTCPDGSTKSADKAVSGDEWRRFEALVLEIDVQALEPRYECTEGCPTDAPPTRWTFEVDGTTTEVLIDTAADPPSSIRAVSTRLDELAADLDRPTCG